MIDEKIRQLTIKNADAQTIKNQAISAGHAHAARGRRAEGAGRHDHHRRGPDDHRRRTWSSGDAGLRLEGPRTTPARRWPARKDADGPKGAAPDAAQGRHLRHRAPRGAGRRRRAAPAAPATRRAARRCRSSSARSISAGCSSACGPQEVAVLTRQLATLLKAGIPLAEALGALAEQADNKKLADGAGRGPPEGERGHARWPTRSPRTRRSSPSSTSTWSARARRPATWTRCCCAWPTSWTRRTRCASKVIGRADLPDHDDGPGRDRHGRPDGRGRPEDHRRCSRTWTRRCPGTRSC